MSKKTSDGRGKKSGKSTKPAVEPGPEPEPEAKETSAEPIEEKLTDEGYEAWLSLLDRLEDLEIGVDRLPSVDTSVVIEEMRKKERELVFDKLDEIRSHFGFKVRNELNEAVERQDTVCSALLYAEAKHQIVGEVKKSASKEQIDALYAEAKDYQAMGFHWLPVLKATGLIDEDQVARIRSGHGKKDTASDIRIIGEHLSASWDLLKPLQKKVEKVELRLTKRKIDRMRAVGSKLTDMLAGKREEDAKAGEIDWRDQVIALYQLLEEDYHKIRETAVFHYRWSKRFDEAEKLGSLKSLHMATLPRAPKHRADEKGEEKPTEEKPTEEKPTEPTPEEAHG